jgi:hypothetical protein
MTSSRLKPPASAEDRILLEAFKPLSRYCLQLPLVAFSVCGVFIASDGEGNREADVTDFHARSIIETYGLAHHKVHPVPNQQFVAAMGG